MDYIFARILKLRYQSLPGFEPTTSRERIKPDLSNRPNYFNLLFQGPPHFIYNGTDAPTTTSTTTTTISTVSTTVITTEATKKKWFTKSITQRPKRTTTPMPTEENPLLRYKSNL